MSGRLFPSGESSTHGELGLLTERNYVEREKLTIRHMIGIYCRGQHYSASGTCADCSAIVRYAYDRIEKCPFTGSAKPACGLCRTNCFSADMYRQFAQIMRYVGPRMLVRHPVLTMSHIWDAVRWKMRK